MRAVAGRPREEVDYHIGRVLLGQINNSKIAFVGSNKEAAVDESPRERRDFDVIFPPELPNSSTLDALLTGLGFPVPWQYRETFESSDEDEDVLEEGDEVEIGDDRVLPSESEGEAACPPNAISQRPDPLPLLPCLIRQRRSAVLARSDPSHFWSIYASEI